MKTRQYQILKTVLVVLPFYLFTSLPLTAQTFTQRLQKHSGSQGTVVIHQSDSIDQLVNTTVLGNVNRPQTPPSSPASGNSSTPAAKPVTPTTADKTPAGQDEQAEEIAKPRTIKAIGYRVQAFAGGNSRADRQRAEAIRNSIKSHFPNVPVYVHFYSPRWICRVGNYRTYEEAHQMLSSLKSLGFDQCTIVKGKISVASY
mgnify:CR=1 FL=1